ncbi:MAG: phosphoribosylanthranilate isomerase [Gemmatimonadaceae bacterium]
MRGLSDNGAALLTRRPGTVRVKICCIATDAEADLAIDAGADALGLVSAMPSGPGPIEEEKIESIIRGVGTRAATVLLTSRQDAPGIGAQLDRVRPTVVQLVDELTEGDYVALRLSHPSVVLMQVIHVRGGDSVREAATVAPFVDALLLDSGNPTATVKELGGTGRVHDWSISRAICDAARLPVFLAGGLRTDNVAEALERVRPFGVDVCSGVRTEGRLDRDKLRAFMHAARSSLTN